jgi:N-acetylated-alpha-linked acidic dipeptidase
MTFSRRLLSGAALASLAFGTIAPAASPSFISDEKAREISFDSAISSADQTAWLKDMSSAPNHVGSPHDKANA